MTRYHAERPIFLWGMAGVGKSTVGRQLALSTSRDFIDLDDEITRESGREVDEIFANSGETEFRRLEALTLKKRLAQPEPLVISLGGGALLDNALRRDARSTGTVVYLKGTVDTLMQRLGNSHQRPLLVGEDLRSRVEETLTRRITAYQDTDLHIVTDGKTSEMVSREIADMLESERAA